MRSCKLIRKSCQFNRISIKVIYGKKQFTTFEEYLEHQPKEIKEVLFELTEIILSAAPNATKLINYNIPSFALVDGGKREQQIMIAAYKKHVGFYPHPSTMEKFWDKLDDYKKGKGSVQFPLSEPLPKKLITEMVKYRKSLLNQNSKS